MRVSDWCVPPPYQSSCAPPLRRRWSSPRCPSLSWCPRAASGLAVTVPFTLSGTGTGADYSATASPLSIPAGSTTASVTITLTNDTLDEADETVIVTMGSRTTSPSRAAEEVAARPPHRRGLLRLPRRVTLPVPEGSAFGSTAFTFTVQGAGGKPLALAAPVTVSAKYSAADKSAGALKLMAYNGDMRWVDLRADDDGMGVLRANTTMTGLFAIVVELPRPVLAGPAAGTVTPDLGPFLSWTNPSGTTQHQLQVIPFNDDGPGIDLILAPSTGSGNEGRYQVQAPVFGHGRLRHAAGMSYTWRVRTSSSPNPLGETDAGWSHWVSF